MKGYFSYERYLMLKLKGIDVKKVEYTRSDRRKYGNTIPECCCRIGDRTFEGCSTKELTIPSNVKSFGYNCFNKCRNLNKIYVRTELKNNISIEVHNYYGSTKKEFPFVAILCFNKNHQVRPLFKKFQKDETIPLIALKSN